MPVLGFLTIIAFDIHVVVAATNKTISFNHLFNNDFLVIKQMKMPNFLLK